MGLNAESGGIENICPFWPENTKADLSKTKGLEPDIAIEKADILDLYLLTWLYSNQSFHWV